MDCFGRVCGGVLGLFAALGGIEGYCGGSVGLGGFRLAWIGGRSGICCIGLEKKCFSGKC